MQSATFLFAELAIALFGLPAAFHPQVRHLPAASRAAAAFAAGGVLLTTICVALSIYRIPWTIGTIVLAAALIDVPLLRAWRRESGRTFLCSASSPEADEGDHRNVRPLVIVSLFLIALSLIILTTLIATQHALSLDWVFAWGTKGLVLAQRGGLDPAVIGSPFFAHTRPAAPPLYAITLAFGAMVSGGVPWLAGPLVTVLWVAATVALLIGFLGERMTRDRALPAAAFWCAAVVATIWSASAGGAAESAMLLYATLACLAVTAREPGSHRFLAATGLAGCAATTQEGWVVAGALLAGAILRDRSVRCWAGTALAGGVPIALWEVFCALEAIPVAERGAVGLGALPAVIRLELLALHGGTWWVPWVAPLLVLMFGLAGNLRSAGAWLPCVSGIAALWLSLTLRYLQSAHDTNLVVWTFPGAMLPALSFLVIAAATAGPEKSA